MRSFRVVARGIVVSGCLLAGGMINGGVAAQTAEPTSGPLQLLQLIHPGKSEAKPGKLAAKPAAKSAVKSAGKSSAKTRIAARRRLQARVVAAERKQHQIPATAQAAAEPAPDNSWPAAPTAATVDAATLAPTSQSAAAPQITAPVAAGTPTALVVDGQTVQVASADEANEIDLAANDAGVANAASLGPKLASNTPVAAVAEAAANLEPASAALVETQTPEVSTASWILQILAALGGAVAAGTVAWLLMRSAPRRVELSE